MATTSHATVPAEINEIEKGSETVKMDEFLQQTSEQRDKVNESLIGIKPRRQAYGDCDAHYYHNQSIQTSQAPHCVTVSHENVPYQVS